MSTIAPMVSVEPKQPTFKKPISFKAWKRKPIKIEKNSLYGKFAPSGDFIVVNQIMGNFLNELLASRLH